MQDELFDPALTTGTAPKTKPKLEEIRAGRVDFRVALTPRTGANTKVKNGFAAAVARLESAKVRHKYFQELSRFSAGVEAELIDPAEKVYGEWVEKEIRLLDSWYDLCPHKLTRHRRQCLREVITMRLEHAIRDLGRYDLQDLLDRHQPPLSAEEKAQADEETRRFLEQMLGVKIDPKASSGQSTPEQEAPPDGEYVPEPESAAGGFRASGRPKSKRQLEKEAQQKQAQ